MNLIAALLLLGATSPAPAPKDLTVAELRVIADRFDRAQIDKDLPALEALIAPDLVYIDGEGKRHDKRKFIQDYSDPDETYQPITIVDRVLMPLGKDAGIANGEVVLRGTSHGKPFASHFRFADTFHRVNGKWLAVHIQVTRMPPVE